MSSPCPSASDVSAGRGELTRQEVEGKIRRYEEFANERLRGDLARVIAARAAVFSDIAEYEQLATVVEALQQRELEHADQTPPPPLKTLVDLGENFYVRARVPDTKHLFVCVGYGFFVELSHEETLSFVGKKVDQLAEKGRLLSRQASAIRARIQLVLEALNELTFAPQPPAPRGSSGVVW